MNIIKSSLLASLIFSTSIHSMEIQNQPHTTSPNVTSWERLIESKKTAMNSNSYELITRQYAAYKAQKVPKTSDQVIRSIPLLTDDEVYCGIGVYSQIVTINYPQLIIESQHLACHPKYITMMPSPNKPYESPDHNAGHKESSSVRMLIYDAIAQATRELWIEAKHFGFQYGQVQIKVFEGLRTLATQKLLFDNKVKEILADNPHLTPDQAHSEASKWVSPVRKEFIPPHSTGAAIDIRLWDSEKEQFLDLGKFGAIWGDNPTAPTFSEELTDEQKNNRLYLLVAATNAGLVNYPFEYWHFSAADQYAAHWLGEEAALFNAIQGN